MNYLLLVFFVFAGSLFSIGMRQVWAKNFQQSILVTGTISLFIAIGFCIYSLFVGFEVSKTTLLFSVLFSVEYVTTVTCYYIAQQNGPLTYSSFVMMASMVIPTLGGWMLWGEKITFATWIGVALFLAAFYFICIPGGEKGQKINKKWIVFSALAFCFNGFAGVTVKSHQELMHGQQGSSMLALAYVMSALICAGIYIMFFQTKRNVTPMKEDFIIIRAGVWHLMYAAIGNGLANLGIVLLSTKIPAAYLFPVFNALMQIVLTIYAMIFLKERITKYGMMGLGVGMVALVVINIK